MPGAIKSLTPEELAKLEVLLYRNLAAAIYLYVPALEEARQSS